MNGNNSDLPILAPDERLDEVNEQICLIQKKNGLTFGTDAYLLASYVRPTPRERAVDLGSGTGIIPLLLLARNKVSSVFAVEVQENFCDLITRNAALNNVASRLRPLCADVRELTTDHTDGEVDLVVSNPPYMPINNGKRNTHDEKFVARHEVYGNISDFCATAGRLLRYGGRFVCVWRPDRLSELMQGLRGAMLEPKRMTFVHADAESEPCMVLLEAKKGAAPSLRISAPLLLYLPLVQGENRRTLTPQAQKIYDTCQFFD